MYGTPGSTESGSPSVRSAPLLRTNSLAFEQLLGRGSSSLPINPAVELPASAVCRRTSLAGPCEDVASSVIVTVGANAGGSSDRTLRMTRDAADGEIVSYEVELESVRLGASVANSEGVALPERLGVGMLPCELTLGPESISVEVICGVDRIAIVDELESKELLLLMLPASEVVLVVEPASGVTIDRTPVVV